MREQILDCGQCEALAGTVGPGEEQFMAFDHFGGVLGEYFHVWEGETCLGLLDLRGGIYLIPKLDLDTILCRGVWVM